MHLRLTNAILNGRAVPYTVRPDIQEPIPTVLPSCEAAITVGLFALWMPIVVSAVFVFIALMIIHAVLGWHKDDMSAMPGEAKVMEMLRGLNVQPGDYRFPFGRTTKTKRPRRNRRGLLGIEITNNVSRIKLPDRPVDDDDR